jgi:hypothetical protein
MILTRVSLVLIPRGFETAPKKRACEVKVIPGPEEAHEIPRDDRRPGGTLQLELDVSGPTFGYLLSLSTLLLLPNSSNITWRS